jgi:carbohydrate binding protein with CBM6 domain
MRLFVGVCVCAAILVQATRSADAVTSTPYTGTAPAIPGIIQAANFDDGGEGVAYHDTTSGNTGGAYRQTDVDIEPSTDGGYDVGWVAAGEWLNYSVAVLTAGTYTVTFRVASAGGGGAFHLEMNGANVTGTVSVPDTGGWQSWQSVARIVTLSAGAQTARLVMDTAAGRKNVVGNIASMRFDAQSASASTPYSGTPAAVPGTIQAENFDRGGEGVGYHDTTSGNTGGAYRPTNVDIEPSSSGGYNVGWAVAGEWLNYTVNVSAGGTYNAGFRVASSGQGGTFHLEVNGANVTGPVGVPDTGGWQIWQTVNRTVTLNAGVQVARLVMDANATKAVGNFDWIQFTSSTGTTTPSSSGGGTIQVPAGGDLQAAIDAAQPGDTIVLAAGAVYRGQFMLRVKPGSSYITIRSSAPDFSLPADGVRVSPDNAGQLAKIEGGVAGMPAIMTDPGAHHYRLQFLELVSTYRDNQIVEIGTFGTDQDTLAEVPHDIIVDRCYIHGDPVNGQKRAILLNAASASVINSYISDIRSTVDESQGIGVSNGPGPFTITNNYIEAAGENLMFGGADPSINGLVPSDIRIANNHITKQPWWRGQGYIVKNLLEFKNAQRVVIDNNLMEYCWQQSQQGYAIVLTPRNQDGGSPWSVVQHFQVIRHVASVFNVLGIDDSNTTWTVTNDIVVRNNLFLDVSAASWGGSGVLATMQGGSNIVFDHNTLFSDGTSVVFADNPPTSGFVFTNNIVPDNAWAIMGSNASPGLGTLAAYFPGATFRANVLINGNPSLYPSGNYFPTSVAAVGFVNVGAGDYRLASSSPYAHAATDGGAIGYSGPPVQ